APVITHTQDAPSAPGGDAVSNDFRINIPFVPSGTYSVTLNYVAAAR
ncbi:MAG: large repetitive protein, partial [Pseudonocardiales bacterium]|nr:large repetitive protein [Pseudonocardiales bacterium]